MSTEWRSDLADAVARGLAAEGWGAVVDALGEQAEQLAEHPDAPIDAITPDAPVLAVIACEAGRLGVLLDVDARVSVHLGRSTAVVVDQVSENTRIGLLVLTGGTESEAASVTDFPVEVVAPYEGADGLEERREFLRLAGFTVPAWFSGSGFTEAELIDACGAVVVALARTGRMAG